MFEAFFIVLVALSVACRLILCLLSSVLLNKHFLSHLMFSAHLVLSDMATTDLDFLTVFGLVGAFLGLAGVFLGLTRAFLGLPWPCPSRGVICPLVPDFPDQNFLMKFSHFVKSQKALHHIYHQEATSKPTLLGCIKDIDRSKIKRNPTTHLPSLGRSSPVQCWPYSTMPEPHRSPF